MMCHFAREVEELGWSVLFAELVPWFSSTNAFNVDQMKGSTGKSLEEENNVPSDVNVLYYFGL